MIYKNSYFKKELRQAYIENRISTRKQFLLGLFFGLIAIAVHFVLQTLLKSVLSDTVPHLMQQSYFTTAYTYTVIAFFLYLLNFIFMYDALSFTEIRKNRWYLLVKMGYSPINMIFAKLSALLYSMIFVYTTGFVVTMLMTAFLKYNFIYSYLPALYFVGLIDLMVLGIIIVTASLYFKQRSSSRYFALFAYVCINILRFALGYHKIVSNRAMLHNFYILFRFDLSIYLPVMAAIVLVCLGICFFKAGDIAKYYSIPYENYNDLVPEDAQLVMRDSKTGRLISLIKADMSARRSKIFDIISTSVLALIVCLAVAFNVFVILISTSQPGKEVTIRGIIPYIFASETMKPTIHENDLAYFRRVDPYEKVEIGEIVLFTEGNKVYIERVIEIKDDMYIVDIDHYPPMAQKGAMIKTVERSEIYGIYTDANRWLGALILFANTIFGRLVFLFVPVLLLFFYKPIKSFFISMSAVTSDDD